MLSQLTLLLLCSVAEICTGLLQDSVLGSILPAITGPPVLTSLPVITASSGSSGLSGGLNVQCGGCYVVAGFTVVTLTDSTSHALSRIGDMSSPAVYLVFTAYAFTSTTVVNGICSAIKGPQQQISHLSYSFPPDSVPYDFLTAAESSFISSIGFPTCGVSGAVLEFTSTWAPQTVGSTTTGTTLVSDSSPTGLSLGTKFGIGIAISVGTIALIMFGVFLWRRDRKQSRAILKPPETTEQQEDTSEPFVRQKAELDAEQRRHEMEANTRHELEEGGRHELDAEDRRQELKGDDHSRELEVPE